MVAGDFKATVDDILDLNIKEVVESRGGMPSLNDRITSISEKADNANDTITRLTGDVNNLNNFTNSLQNDVTNLITDVEDLINTNSQHLITHDGYKILSGGLIIQWGSAKNLAGSQISERIYFPIPFNKIMYNVQITGRWSNSSNHFWTVGGTDYRTYFESVKNGSLDASDAFYWFAIGE